MSEPEITAALEEVKQLDAEATAGGLLSLRRNARFPYKDYPADLSDCLVVRPKPWRIEVMEPLPVEAPGPHQAEAYCCYIQTVKFYKRPLRSSTGGECDLWDECETRLSWDDVVQFESDAFVIGGGSVIWADGKWWMRRNARRLEGPLPLPPQAKGE